MEGAKSSVTFDYQPSYHGDPQRSHQMWIYDQRTTPENYMIWDFKQDINQICTKNNSSGGNSRTCLGHEIGCKLFPSFHGDPKRQHKFWVYYNGQNGQNPWDHISVPCENAVFVKDNGQAFEFICLGHYDMYHGNMINEESVFKHEAGGSAQGIDWNYMDQASFVCSNHKEKGNNEFICNGHSHGDKYVPTYHGTQQNGFKFNVIPLGKNIENPLVDFWSADICNNKKLEETKNGIETYSCLGHSITFHGDPSREHSFWLHENNPGPHELKWDFKGQNPLSVCSHHKKMDGNQYICLGHSSLGDSQQPAYHGDPEREWKFWIYPKQSNLVTPAWDFKVNPCSNSKMIQKIDNDVVEYQCLGHKYNLADNVKLMSNIEQSGNRREAMNQRITVEVQPSQNIRSPQRRQINDGSNVNYEINLIIIQENVWYEIKPVGKLPERRANHASFFYIQDQYARYYYVHGGRDLKSGAFSNMWRINIQPIQDFINSFSGDSISLQNNFNEFQWEQVQFKGKGPGPISHHKIVKGNENHSFVLLGGVVRGEESNTFGYLFDAKTSTWTQITSYQAWQCSLSSNSLSWNKLEVTSLTNSFPKARNGHSSVIYNSQMIIFGGLDDENNKLNDIWKLDLASNSWSILDLSSDQNLPQPRSGHSAVCLGHQMFVFGGIHEITQELNDIVVVDLNSNQVSILNEEMDNYHSQHEDNYLGASPQFKQRTESLSPNRIQKRGASPAGKKQSHQHNSSTSNKNSQNASPTGKQDNSPKKKQTMKSPTKGQEKEEEQKGLQSPTSITMQNSFIIKNADASFDVYYHQMKKRKAVGYNHSLDNSMVSGHMPDSKFGVTKGKRPPPRDGHSFDATAEGFAFVFGGDRHLMPFNDLYVIKLKIAAEGTQQQARR